MKKVISLFVFLMLITLIVFGQDSTAVGEPVTSAFDWTDFITGLVSLALGAWGGRTAFADKTGKEKAKWKGKVDQLDSLLSKVLDDLRSNTFTKEKVKQHIEEGKDIIKS